MKGDDCILIVEQRDGVGYKRRNIEVRGAVSFIRREQLRGFPKGAQLTVLAGFRDLSFEGDRSRVTTMSLEERY